MVGHRATYVAGAVLVVTVLFLTACGVEPAPLPPSPFLSQRTPGPPPAPSENDRRADLFRRLAQRTGPDAIDCGTFEPRRRDPEPASRVARLEHSLACLHSESVRRHPAYLAIQRQGIDSWIANGLFTKTDGAIWAFGYETDPFGVRSPEMRSWQCPAPVVRTEPDWAPEVDCHP